MNKNQFFKAGLGWGIFLWFFGYVLGILLFMVVKPDQIGWFILPIGVLVTYWVVSKKIHNYDLVYLLKIGIIWSVIAVVFDYLFIVQMFHSANYYKVDVFVYYLFTFILPPAIGWYKQRKNS